MEIPKEVWYLVLGGSSVLLILLVNAYGDLYFEKTSATGAIILLILMAFGFFIPAIKQALGLK